jgi:hypothetical protein
MDAYLSFLNQLKLEVEQTAKKIEEKNLSKNDLKKFLTKQKNI